MNKNLFLLTKHFNVFFILSYFTIVFFSENFSDSAFFLENEDLNISFIISMVLLADNGENRLSTFDNINSQEIINAVNTIPNESSKGIIEINANSDALSLFGEGLKVFGHALEGNVAALTGASVGLGTAAILKTLPANKRAAGMLGAGLITGGSALLAQMFKHLFSKKDSRPVNNLIESVNQESSTQKTMTLDLNKNLLANRNITQTDLNPEVNVPEKVNCTINSPYEKSYDFSEFFVNSPNELNYLNH